MTAADSGAHKAIAGEPDRPIGWVGIFRCALVQMSLGAVVVLCTSTLNRVMVVELALAAMIPGALVGLHYAVQLSRPRWGYGSDKARRRTTWIVGGMATLALGALMAAASVYLIPTSMTLGIGLAVLAFAVIGAGVGASGTSLLAFVAAHVKTTQKGPAATICWLMMIAGMAVTAGVAGGLLDPYSPARLMAVAAGVAGLALLLTMVATFRLEPPEDAERARIRRSPEANPGFRIVLKEVWGDADAREFTIFVFVSMLAYSAQDLILEPFAGLVFGMTPGQSTQLSGIQHGGVLVGMIAVALACSGMARGRFGTLRDWTVGGCIASALALASIVLGGFLAPAWPLTVSVFLLGAANGAFAVGAIGSMMVLASAGNRARQGTRMGLWGAAQAIAFALGGFMGTALVDLTNQFFASPVFSYGSVFSAEALMFIVSAVMATKIGRQRGRRSEPEFPAHIAAGAEAAPRLQQGV